jgi:hypothetical protein
MPDESSALIGLSKYARLVEWVMARPPARRARIVIEADHHCMQWRGVKDTDFKMTNNIMRGAYLKNLNLRREFLALLASAGAEGKHMLTRASARSRCSITSRSNSAASPAGARRPSISRTST